MKTFFTLHSNFNVKNGLKTFSADNLREDYRPTTSIPNLGVVTAESPDSIAAAFVICLKLFPGQS